MPNTNDEIPFDFDSWRIFRILSEFVDGFETMISIGPSVSFFGSARTEPGASYYDLAVEVAKKVSEKGFAIITGGGPGIMEAANKGARIAGGKSCGLSIDLPHEYEPNEFVDKKYDIRFRHFFVRKVMFVRYAQAFVVMPGGFGTLDELFESLNLMQTEKIKPFPIYLVGESYWKGLIDWMKDTLVSNGTIAQEDLNLINIIDDPTVIADGIEKNYLERKAIKNF